MTQASLTLTRDIERPTRDAMLQSAQSVQQFWSQNTQLFEDAWAEWEKNENLDGLTLDNSPYAPALHEAVEAA